MRGGVLTTIIPTGCTLLRRGAAIRRLALLLLRLRRGEPRFNQIGFVGREDADRVGPAGALQGELNLESSGTSQHLGVLRRHGVLETRKQGTTVYYRVRDPRTFQLLDSARQITSSSLEAAQALLGELATPPATTSPDRGGAATPR